MTIPSGLGPLTTPLDPRVAMLVETFDVCQLEAFHERAAIIEEGSRGITRGEAEVEALLEVLSSPLCPPVRFFRLERPGGPQWVLTTDPDNARLQALGAELIPEESLRDVLRLQFNGLAFLTPAL